MVYGGYIYTIPMVYKPTFTSLGGHHLVPNHKPINLAKALVFPNASHEQNASSQHPIIPNDRLQEQPRPWETHGKPMEKT
jgi:hypothetical protein